MASEFAQAPSRFWRWVQKVFWIALPVMYLSTMPGYALQEEFYRVIGLYGDARGIGGSLLESSRDSWYQHAEPAGYGGSFLFSLVALVFWPLAYGFYRARAKDEAFRVNLIKAVVAFSLPLLGKFVDLGWEGRSFTGNYWAVASAICLLPLPAVSKTAARIGSLSWQDFARASTLTLTAWVVCMLAYWPLAGVAPFAPDPGPTQLFEMQMRSLILGCLLLLLTPLVLVTTSTAWEGGTTYTKIWRPELAFHTLLVVLLDTLVISSNFWNFGLFLFLLAMPIYGAEWIAGRFLAKRLEAPDSLRGAA